jgi:tetratricopeptide (TPR) repeat protein
MDFVVTPICIFLIQAMGTKIVDNLFSGVVEYIEDILDLEVKAFQKEVQKIAKDTVKSIQRSFRNRYSTIISISKLEEIIFEGLSDLSVDPDGLKLRLEELLKDKTGEFITLNGYIDTDKVCAIVSERFFEIFESKCEINELVGRVYTNRRVKELLRLNKSGQEAHLKTHKMLSELTDSMSEVKEKLTVSEKQDNYALLDDGTQVLEKYATTFKNLQRLADENNTIEGLKYLDTLEHPNEIVDQLTSEKIANYKFVFSINSHDIKALGESVEYYQKLKSPGVHTRVLLAAVYNNLGEHKKSKEILEKVSEGEFNSLNLKRKINFFKTKSLVLANSGDFEAANSEIENIKGDIKDYYCYKLKLNVKNPDIDLLDTLDNLLNLDNLGESEIVSLGEYLVNKMNREHSFSDINPMCRFSGLEHHFSCS